MVLTLGGGLMLIMTYVVRRYINLQTTRGPTQVAPAAISIRNTSGIRVYPVYRHTGSGLYMVIPDVSIR